MIDRRTFLLAGLAVAATAACADGVASPEPAVTTGSTADGAFPRTVEHELGSAELPARPERIVCGTDGSELCSLLALGLTPVGYGKRNDPPPSWLAGLTGDLDSYDLSSGETNYERLVAWEPDLLLVQRGFATQETLPRFQEIAPTVATSFVDWRDNLRQVGEAVGLEDRAAELEAETDAAVEALRADLPTAAAGLRVNALAAFDDGSVYALNDQSPLGKLAAALGLAPLPAQVAEGEAIDLISLEQLDLVDGDLLVVLHFGEGDGAPALKTQGVWTGLEVVQAGRVVDLTEDESNQLYFDAVLTVEPNAELITRLVTEALA